MQAENFAALARLRKRLAEQEAERQLLQDPQAAPQLFVGFS